MIQIMKASAGSGKTFSLARKYITMLFRKNDRYAYRHILAVTFTNKATDEMKSRILKELYILASAPEESAYLKWFIPSMFSKEELADVDPDDIVTSLPGVKGPVTPESLKSAARDVLSNILNDYSAFAISTIDRFFQQTLKAFSKEMGQFASYQVELDKDGLIKETADRLLDSLSEENEDLLKWLTDNVIEQLENGGYYRLEKDLTDMATKLKSDQHRTLVESLGIPEEELYSRDNMRAMKSHCDRIVRDFIDEVKSKAQAVLGYLNSVGVAPDLFKKLGRAPFFTVVEKDAVLTHRDEVIVPSDSFMKNAADPQSWFKKGDEKKYLPIVDPGLSGPLGDFCALFQDLFRIYKTAKMLRGQYYKLGVAIDIYEKFNEVLRERNVLSLDDSNVLLKDIIDGSDAPFIYEKTGVRYENFLLDEFQDTSVVQWENFRPLIIESASNGEDNLVVGDVKQSIYRWRDSDWNLLDHEVGAALDKYGVKSTVLDKNFRSWSNIVDFNNKFFAYAAEDLDIKLPLDLMKSVQDIYSDVAQKVTAKENEAGAVKVTFCDKDKEMEVVKETILGLHEKGVPFSDIAVLVRKNKSGKKVASELIQQGIPVITDDSLKAKASPTVRKIAALMAYADNSQDKVNSFLAGPEAAELPKNYRSLQELCEEICRMLKRHDPKSFDESISYVNAFADTLLDYVSKYGNDLSGFLNAWKDMNPAISSPSSADAVRIITVHKAKGLDFRYVIFPFAEEVTLYQSDNGWCKIDPSDPLLGADCAGIYDIPLSKSSCNGTVFEPDFMIEQKKQYIDNLNIFYVAVTRPVAGLHIVVGDSTKANMCDILRSWLETRGSDNGFVATGTTAPTPPLPQSGSADPLPQSDSSSLLTQMVSAPPADPLPQSDVTSPLPQSAGQQPSASGFDRADYERGDLFNVIPLGKKAKAAPAEMIPSSYESYPLNSPEKERLVFSGDSSDYFSDEMEHLPDAVQGLAPSTARSARTKGIILHDILSTINTMADIAPALATAAASGKIEVEDIPRLEQFFVDKLSSVADQGWFDDSGAKILNEVELVDTDGSLHRPDRVILKDDGTVIIIDYKFGAPKSSYKTQIATYRELWSRMGHPQVSAHLWYVMRNEIVSSQD